jgi:hypothetical protein
MNGDAKIDLLAKALVQAQSELRGVGFDSTNPFFKSKYASLGAVIETVKPVLFKYGLAVTQLVIAENGYAGIETILLHESGQWLATRAMLPVDMKNVAQESGKIITYLRRYALSAILGVYSEEDNDGATIQKQEQQPLNAKITPSEGIVEPVSGMTLEEAGNELSHDGTPYREISDEQLGKKLIGIRKKLNMPDLPSEERATYQRKEDAILALRFYRGQK